MYFKKVCVFIIVSMFLSACGEKASPMPEAATATLPIPTITPDLCSTQNLPDEAAKVNKLMREFDDYAALASNTPQIQLVQVIPELQRVFREAQDQPVPTCLERLKELQLIHMNAVVQTLMAFMSNTDPDQVNQGIAQAREVHNQYNLELARLLGITLVAAPTIQPGAITTPSAVSMQALNATAADINLRSLPDVNALAYAALSPGQSALVNGKTADNQWLRVEVPNQPGVSAWVFAELVQVSFSLDQIPVVTP